MANGSIQRQGGDELTEDLSPEQRIARCEMLLKLILVIQFPQLYGLL